MGTYNVDPYSGPGALESLVGSFLDTTRETQDRRRKLAQEAQDRAEKATRAQELADANRRADVSFKTGMAEKGYVPDADATGASPTVPIPGSPGMAFQPPRYQKVAGTGYSLDRLRDPDTLTRQATITKEVTEQGRRTRLERLVGVLIDPHATEQDKAAAKQQFVSTVPAGQETTALRDLTPDAPKVPTPRNIDPLSPEGISAEVRRARGLAAVKPPKDDRATWEERQYRANLATKNPETGGLTLLYETPQAARDAAQAQADAFFGPRPGAPPPRAPPTLKDRWTAAVGTRAAVPGAPKGLPVPSTGLPSLDELEQGYQRGRSTTALAPASGRKPLDVQAIRAKAQSAIDRGADPAAVKARFKQLTGLGW
jgi:hypothetical protein